LINRLCQDPMKEARELCTQQLQALPPMAVRESKRLLKSTCADKVKAVMESEVQSFGKGLQGPEFAEAVAAFFEKRQPKF
jgi:enoyl-CoA hydratase/carnithine racemase